MEWLAALLALASGLIIRLALPIGVTVIAVYLLRKLDARWQAEGGSQEQYSIGELEGIPCWEIKNCPPDRRVKCPAYTSSLPCWQVHRQPNGYLLEDCLSCEVLRDAPLPLAHAQI